MLEALVVDILAAANKLDSAPPNIEPLWVVVVGAPNMDPLGVWVVAAPNIEPLCVFVVGVPNIEPVCVVVGVPNIELWVFVVDVPNIEPLWVVAAPKIDDGDCGDPKTDVWVVCTGVPNTDACVVTDGVPKIDACVVPKTGPAFVPKPGEELNADWPVDEPNMLWDVVVAVEPKTLEAAALNRLWAGDVLLNTDVVLACPNTLCVVVGSNIEDCAVFAKTDAVGVLTVGVLVLVATADWDAVTLGKIIGGVDVVVIGVGVLSITGLISAEDCWETDTNADDCVSDVGMDILLLALDVPDRLNALEVETLDEETDALGVSDSILTLLEISFGVEEVTVDETEEDTFNSLSAVEGTASVIFFCVTTASVVVDVFGSVTRLTNKNKDKQYRLFEYFCFIYTWCRNNINRFYSWRFRFNCCNFWLLIYFHWKSKI